MERALSQGINIKINSDTRTYEEQNKLFRQGRFGNPGPIVTNAKKGRSNHNFGIAWDIGIFSNDGSYSIDDNDYLSVAENSVGNLIWGGNWSSFPDPPHYQLKTIEPNITWIRFRFENSETYVA